MSENSWKSPGAVIGIIGAVVAIAGLYFNYLSNKNEQEKIRIQETHDRQIQNELREVRQKKEDRIIELENQLSQIKNNIQECRENIGRANMGAGVALSCLSNPDKTQNEKDACQADLQYAKDLSESNTKAWKDFEEKENDLNKQINDLKKEL